MHILPKKITKYPLFVRAFFWKQKRTYGEVLKPGMLWARSPLVFATLALQYGALNRKSSPLDAALRSLITVRVSQVNHCAFCIDINSATLIKRGVSMKKVEALSDWRSNDIFTEVERVALEYAESVTYSDREVDAALIGQLKKHFDDDAIVELTGLICFQNMSSKFNAALDVPAAGFCLMPTREKSQPKRHEDSLRASIE